MFTTQVEEREEFRLKPSTRENKGAEFDSAINLPDIQFGKPWVFYFSKISFLSTPDYRNWKKITDIFPTIDYLEFYENIEEMDSVFIEDTHDE